MEDFSYLDKSNVKLLSIEPINQSNIAKAYFSTRIGGVSTDDYKSLNLSWSHKDTNENIIKNYSLACKAAGFCEQDLVFCGQTHSTNVHITDKNDCNNNLWLNKKVQNTDALITNQKNIVLTVRTADCVPVFILDSKTKCIAAIHSGWRGTVNAITLNALNQMKNTFGTEGDNCTAFVGPCICQKCFEVDNPVFNEFASHYPGSNHIIKKGAKYHIDLPAYIKDQLLSFGIKENNICLSNICTSCNTDLYFSHRAEHGHTGGMCGFISLI